MTMRIEMKRMTRRDMHFTYSSTRSMQIYTDAARAHVFMQQKHLVWQSKSA